MLLLALAGCRSPVPPSPPAPRAAPQDLTRFHVVMINGGAAKAQNYQSHLLHVRELLDLLTRAGVRRQQVAIFSSDGTDPAADLAMRELQPERDFALLRGTRLESALRTPIVYADSRVPGATLRPATKAAISAWFASEGAGLRAGDTLLLYVTDHGTKNGENLADNRITLWGAGESLPVTELRALIEPLDPGVRVVALMSQCFSGSFANLVYANGNDGLPGGNVCGYYSSTPDRMAYGCYPENRGKENVGHSFEFIRALAATPRFPDAQREVLVADATPDVPLTSADVWLESLLERAAKAAGEKPTPFADALLRRAWRDKAAWEPEIRLLDRIGQTYGIFSPRSLTEVDEQLAQLPATEARLKSYADVWKEALGDLSQANLDRFIARSAAWEPRLRPAALTGLDEPATRDLTAALLAELAPFTTADPPTAERLRTLGEKSDLAAAATYRMQVRLGVVLRMRAVLTDIAGRVHLASGATPAERAAYEALRACEDLVLGTPGAVTPIERAPFPSYADDLRVAEGLQPAWMGIRFRPTPPARRARRRLADGAATVLAVYPGSPAEAAGLRVGDIIVGPPGAPFTEPRQIREWTMLSPVGEPAPLEVVRRARRIHVTLVPQPFPQKWPELPGPPAVGSVAPPLRLAAYRGHVPTKLAGGRAHLLFFWATWCRPCKAALPELLAFARESGTEVLAVTDELPEQLDPFFAELREPFPAHVAVDAERRTFLAYGVSGTPTFVLVDAAGTVRSYGTGYDPAKGLGVDGWRWAVSGAASPSAPARPPSGG